MNLTDRERKLLWTRAANRCSYRFDREACGTHLSVTKAGREVVVGEECHIVGERPTSARYEADYPNPESYENAILLCSVHHKIVDDEATRHLYPPPVLAAMKRDHEARASLETGVLISDSHFTTEATRADLAVGMDLSEPTTLSGVTSSLKAQDVKVAVGLRTSGLHAGIVPCSKCGFSLPFAHAGGGNRHALTCPRCGALT